VVQRDVQLRPTPRPGTNDRSPAEGIAKIVHSEINAYDGNGNFRGTIPVNAGGNNPGGLWALNFGNQGSNGNPDTLYFTDGINGETDGLFAAISIVPEPNTLALLGVSVLTVYGLRRWRYCQRWRTNLVGAIREVWD
jgi:hypothetical protein